MHQAAVALTNTARFAARSAANRAAEYGSDAKPVTLTLLPAVAGTALSSARQENATTIASSVISAPIPRPRGEAFRLVPQTQAAKPAATMAASAPATAFAPACCASTQTSHAAVPYMAKASPCLR